MYVCNIFMKSVPNGKQSLNDFFGLLEIENIIEIPEGLVGDTVNDHETRELNILNVT